MRSGLTPAILSLLLAMIAPAIPVAARTPAPPVPVPAQTPAPAVPVTAQTPAPVVDALDAVPAQSGGRVIHVFDFDERPDNLESIPMFWVPFRPTGFPRYADGAMDDRVGHDAPPSFRLDPNGRNVAYRYTGRDTRVRARGDYRITGFIRTDRLSGARACLAAHFLDQDLKPIAGTHVRSPYLGETGEADDTGETGDIVKTGDTRETGETGETWRRVELRLPHTPPQAYAVGLVAMVLQESAWDRQPRTRRFIERVDLGARVWFDDISIHLLPRIEFTTSVPGNVFSGADRRQLDVLVRDDNGVGLSADVRITDTRGAVVLEQAVNVETREDRPPGHVDLSDFQTGFYQARLDVALNGRVIETRDLTFAVVAVPNAAPNRRTSSLGVVLSSEVRADVATEAALLARSGAGAAKIALWTGSAEPGSTDAATPERLAEYRQLQRLGFALTAVLAGPAPDLVRSAGAYPRPLLEVLTGDAQAWREPLAAVVAPSVDVFQTWQLGADNDRAVVSDPRITDALENLRREMAPYVSRPALGIPASTGIAPRPNEPLATDLTLTIEPDVSPAWIATAAALFNQLGYAHVSAFLPTRTERAGDAVARPLTDWTQRLVTARHAGFHAVYVGQPWTLPRRAPEARAEPMEEYVIVHTVADLIDDATAGESIDMGPTATALLFHRGEWDVLAAWDSSADEGGVTRTIQLGSAARQFDVWGRARPIPRAEDGRQVLHLSRMPTFVDGIEPWLPALRHSLRIEPAEVPFSVEPQHLEFSMAHSGDEPISGTVQLIPPPDWTLEPARFRFDLMPGAGRTVPLKASYLGSESAGDKTVLARLDVESDPRRHFEVPLRLHLGFPDLDVHGVAMLEGGDVILRHVVTNRSSEPVSFRSMASVPGRARQYRTMAGIAPDETRAVEYRFTGAGALSGRLARLGLLELGGARFHNLDVPIP